MQVGPETCLSVRLAIYRDGEPGPKVEEVKGTGPQELIHRLCTGVELVIREEGAGLPQAVIRALIENLLHARFAASTVSVLDRGRTLRVSDRGPGIADKRLAVRPGFSTAGDFERRIVAGVGSGLAYATRYAEEAGGHLEISDNLGGGTVVTFAVPVNDTAGTPRDQPGRATAWPEPDLNTDPPSELSDNGKRVLLLLAELGGAGLATVCDELRIAPDSARSELEALRRLGLLDPADQRQIVLTAAGLGYLDGIFVE